MGQCEGGLLLRFYCLLHRRFTEKRRQPTLTLRKAYTEGMLFGAALQYVQKGIEW